MEKLTLHPEARSELIEAIHYYEMARDGLGRDFRLRTEAAFKEIHEDPCRWRLKPAGYRRRNLSRFPCYIAYVIVGDEIRILAVAHGARKPEYWLNRAKDK